ncbi:MAG TPA: zf-HC2 domain-containing protein [Candidatus Polarisedimenticolia bacterium]|nr:zf-HC2 domain-containing protein [Candidatus Polarisedimenticolia bacterium]
MIDDEGTHPELLLWYAAGTLDRERSTAIEEHLAACARCAADVDALRSLAASLARQSRVDHVAAGDLALYEEDPSRLSATRRGAIQGHLSECTGCHEDLRTLAWARRRERRGPSIRRAAAPAAVLAAAALVVVSAVPVIRWARPARAPRETAARVILRPPVRDAAMRAAQLRGTGPWPVTVLLPFDSPVGLYAAELAPARKPSEAVARWTLAVGVEGMAEMEIPELPPAGRWRLTLAPPGEGPSEPIVYRIETEPESGGPGP